MKFLKEFDEMIKTVYYLVGIIGVIALVFTFTIGIAKDVDVLQRDVAELKTEVRAEFVKIDEKFDKIDEKFDKIDEKFDKIDLKFDELNEILRNIAVDVAILNKSSNNASNTESTEKIASSQ